MSSVERISIVLPPQGQTVESGKYASYSEVVRDARGSEQLTTSRNSGRAGLRQIGRETRRLPEPSLDGDDVEVTRSPGESRDRRPRTPAHAKSNLHGCYFRRIIPSL
jgi:Arc/MetJ-type ribon-helix-helix transcriptional regulator